MFYWTVQFLNSVFYCKHAWGLSFNIFNLNWWCIKSGKKIIPSDIPSSKSRDCLRRGMTRGGLELEDRDWVTHKVKTYDSCVTTILKLKRAETVWMMKGKENTSHWIHIFPHQPLHCHSHLLKEKKLSTMKQTLHSLNKRWIFIIFYFCIMKHFWVKQDIQREKKCNRTWFYRSGLKRIERICSEKESQSYRHGNKN